MDQTKRILEQGQSLGVVREKPTKQGRMASIRCWLGFRWRRLKQLPWSVLGVLVGMAIVSSVAGFLGTERGWKGLWQNLGPELAGAVVTYVLLDLVLGTRQRKQDLIARMGSDVRDVAIPAVDELRREGWLTDGSLRGANLSDASLRRAILSDASLEGVSLVGASLENASLWQANLEGADLWVANLGGAYLKDARLANAHLFHAKLKEAELEGADLQEAILVHANLGGAYLEGANLQEANLEAATVSAEQLAQAESLRGTTLPDGTGLSKDNWQAEFDEWRKKQEEQESND